MGIVRRGVAADLEKVANKLLHDSLKGVTSMAEKSDILTPWKEQMRRDREVYVPSGTPDPSNRRGMYHRAWNSEREDLNSRDGLVRPGRTDSLRRFVDDHAEPDWQEG